MLTLRLPKLSPGINITSASDFLMGHAVKNYILEYNYHFMMGIKNAMDFIKKFNVINDKYRSILKTLCILNCSKISLISES